MLSDRAKDLLDLSVDALVARDQAKANAVIEGDREIDNLEIEIEDRAIALAGANSNRCRSAVRHPSQSGCPTTWNGWGITP